MPTTWWAGYDRSPNARRKRFRDAEVELRRALSLREAALRPETRLVSLMLANNEVGSIQPLRQIAEICHERGTLLHTDAAQCIGKISVLVNVLDVDLLTIAGHKFYAPKGIGALFVRDGLALEPALHGADHENGLRPGTQNTPYIVGLGKASLLAARFLDEEGDRLGYLRDRLQDQLVASIPQLRINAGKALRLPNTLSVSFPDATGQDLLARIPELAASTGSACHSDLAHGSATLNSMGLDTATANGTVRLSVGWYTAEEEIDQASSLLIDAWENLMAMA